MRSYYQSIFISLIFISSIHFSFAQNENCIFQDSEAVYLQSVKNSNVHNKKDDNRIVTIPVVFHVVYKRDQENIKDSSLLKALDLLNNCVRRQSKDTSNTRDIFNYCQAS